MKKKILAILLLVADFIFVLGLAGAFVNNSISIGTFIISFIAALIVAVLSFLTIERKEKK